MRKVLLALLLTAVGLGLLLSFRSRPAAGTAALGGSALGGSALGGSALGTGGASGAASPTPGAATPSASPSPSSPSSPSKASRSSAATTKARSGPRDGSYTGAAEPTEYGPVQVRATVSGGRLTDVTVLQVPDRGGYEDQIVQIVVPELKSEALSAQSARIDVISGATYTSQGYAQSLQSALDQAGT